MKIRVTLKDPDAMPDAVTDAYARLSAPHGITDDEWQELRARRASEARASIAHAWMEYSEYLVVEFDTEAGTAVVIPLRAA